MTSDEYGEGEDFGDDLAGALEGVSSLSRWCVPGLSLDEPKDVLLTGEGPFGIEDLAALVGRFHNVTVSLGSDQYKAYRTPIEVPDLCVVGMDDFDEDAIKAVVHADSLGYCVYLPQEAFLDRLLFGWDWYEWPYMLEGMVDRHPGLQFLKSLEGFEWPSTEAEETTSADRSRADVGWADKSELRVRGYEIGDLTPMARWRILTGKCVPELGLKKVVYLIAWLVRKRKAQRGGRERYSYAISQWEHDLERLKRECYEHDFRWPPT